MERRRVKRIKRRLPCEFLHAGNRHRGIVVDLSPGGLFLQTDTALDPGAEVEVHLSGSRFPDISLVAVVARRRFTPAVLSSLIRRGVGLHILSAPPEYYEAVERLGAEEDGSDEASEDVSIEIQVSDEPAPTPEVDAAPALPEPELPEAADAPPPPGLPEEKVEEPAPEAPPEDSGGWIFEPDLPSQALVLDDGELDDVDAILVELGASPARECGADATAFRGWTLPPRLLVATARNALRLHVPPSAGADGVVTIAVAEAESRTLCSMLRRQGFRYVVRRPVHPEALRLLLMRALYRDGERRSTVRLAFGYEITWRSGWSRRRGLLAELSSEGCRVLSAEGAEPGSRVVVRIPREVADGRALSLSGRVLRCERRVGCRAEARHAFALRFGPLSPSTQERLGLLLQERHGGPATLPGRSKARRPRERKRLGRIELASAGSSSTSTPATAGPPGPERRRSLRRPIALELVALDGHEARVKYVLFGRDLSPGGIRVEPHPELRVGDHLRPAIYDSGSVEPLVLDASVERDDRELGFALHFDEVDAQARERLEQLIAEPCFDHQDEENDPAKPLVVTEILPE